jgi:hypothetical protein
MSAPVISSSYIASGGDVSIGALIRIRIMLFVGFLISVSVLLDALTSSGSFLLHETTPVETTTILQ